MKTMTEHAPAPWYRQFWPWLLIGLPGSVVIACIITITIALNHPDPIVNDDWYKDGMAINQIQARDETARALGMQARIQTLDDGLMITLSANQPLPERIQLSLMHPTRDDADIQRILMLDDGVARTGALPINDVGHWYLSIESLPDEQPSWRIRGRWQTGNDALIAP